MKGCTEYRCGSHAPDKTPFDHALSHTAKDTGCSAFFRIPQFPATLWALNDKYHGSQGARQFRSYGSRPIDIERYNP